MTDMVERVAKVLAEADGQREGDISVLYDYYLELARDVLAEMREPTEEIFTINGSANWSKMIDAALSRSP